MTCPPTGSLPVMETQLWGCLATWAVLDVMSQQNYLLMVVLVVEERQCETQEETDYESCRDHWWIAGWSDDPLTHHPRKKHEVMDSGYCDLWNELVGSLVRGHLAFLQDCSCASDYFLIQHW